MRILIDLSSPSGRRRLTQRWRWEFRAVAGVFESVLRELTSAPGTSRKPVRPHPPTDLTEHYRLLGVEPGASPEEVRSAWRAVVREWHPDRFVAGSPEQREAHRRIVAANRAYEAVRRTPVGRGR